MTDEKWIEPLAKLAREENAPMDPRLEQLIEGTISEEDRLALEADASRDPELLSAVEAFRPLDDAARDRIADRVLVSQKSAVVVPIASRRRRPVLIGAIVAAAAVVLALVLTPRSTDTLPLYALELTGGDQVMRSNEPVVGDLIISPATKIEAVVRPAKALVAGSSIDARAFVVLSGRVRAIDLPAQVSPDGAARWVLHGADIFSGDGGEGWLIFAISEPGRMDDATKAAASGASTSGDGFRVLSRKAIFRKTKE